MAELNDVRMNLLREISACGPMGCLVPSSDNEADATYLAVRGFIYRETKHAFSITRKGTAALKAGDGK